MNALAPPAATVGAATILCVDDEANILSSLRRLFRPGGFKVLTAESGAQGLEVLAAQAVDLVISDMRMPHMDGARFLEKVREGWPGVTRMLLTGYADVESTIAAINRGEIARYIQKPWNDSELMLAVRQALERQALVREKERLEALAHRQNEELHALNASLEAKVAKRTQDLREALAGVAKANDQLKAAFLTSIKVFANVVELREGAKAGRSRRVSDLALRVARKLGMAAADTQEVMFAGLLHEIGKIGLTDTLNAKSLGQMTGEEFAAYRRHCITGAAVLTPLASLHPAAALIRALHENFDGSGVPDRLSGLAIPEGARALAVASDFDLAQQGRLTGKALTRGEARSVVQGQSGLRYDPRAVAALCAVLDELEGERAPVERVAGAAQLAPGMVLSRDLVGRNGLLLLAAEHALDDHLIRQIREYERTEGGTRLAIHIRTEGDRP